MLARVVLGAVVVAFLATVARNGFGVTAGWAPAWDYSYNATQFFAAAACWLAAIHSSPRERRAWVALSLGLSGFFLADVYWSVFLANDASPPFPSPADALWLSIYPGAYAALVLLLRARAGRISLSVWLDGLVGALGIAAVGAALVFGIVASTEGSLATVATNLAYPLGDLAMVAFVIGTITVTGWKPGRTWALMAAGFAVFAVADTVYLVQVAKGTYVEFQLLDCAWPAALMLIAFASWQPAKRLDAQRLRGAGMLVLPAGLALTSLGLLVLDHYARQNDFATWFASASVAAIVVRFGLTFRENLRMLRASEAEATTDALTGLGNRRALLRDLHIAAEDADPDRVTVLGLFDLDGFKSYNDAFGHPAGDALLERLGRRLADGLGEVGAGYRMGGDEFCMLVRVAPEEADDVIAVAAAALSEQGERFAIGCSYGVVVMGRDAGHPDEALGLADQRMYSHKRGGRPTREETVHNVLMSVVGEHDSALFDHVGDVADLAEQVAGELQLPSDVVAHVRRAAELHDIGKVAIPDAILQAPRPLEPHEWEYMRQHTIIGARIIGAAPELRPVAEMVRSSHERWDGGGYPDGLAGEDIPLGARIVAVCDSYDAMTTTRPYRDALPVEHALEELATCAGSQFDRDVVEAFATVIAAGGVCDRADAPGPDALAGSSR
jgi:two-component system, cell cycle response regulator